MCEWVTVSNDNCCQNSGLFGLIFAIFNCQEIFSVVLHIGPLSYRPYLRRLDDRSVTSASGGCVIFSFPGHFTLRLL